MRIAVVRGGGDLATGVVQKLHRAGFGVVVTEESAPTTIRRGAAISPAVYCGTVTVEDITARRSEPTLTGIRALLDEGNVAVLVDPNCRCLEFLKPVVVVDAIIAKRNLGTHRGMAKLTIGLGPGFTAPEDVDVAIETMRGHNLGRLIYAGSPQANTGVPAELGGAAGDRVVYAPESGRLKLYKDIGSQVYRGEVIACINNTPVAAKINGLLRGILPEGFDVGVGLKMADIDPRGANPKYCFTISDKARALGGAVLDAVCHAQAAGYF